MDASVRLDEARDADGETVWSWPPDAEVKFCETLAERRWLSKPGHRGERGIDRKPSRRECRLLRPCLWSLPPAFFVAGGPWVRPAPGIPCALLILGAPLSVSPGHFVPREREIASYRHCEERSHEAIHLSPC
jgi:hypothetical protein